MSVNVLGAAYELGPEFPSVVTSHAIAIQYDSDRCEGTQNWNDTNDTYVRFAIETHLSW